MFKHTVVSDEVVIEAPIELVWSILTDTSRYGEWNPFTPKIDTDFKLDSEVHLEVHLGKLTLNQTEIMRAFDAPSRLAWGAGMFKLGRLALVTALREQCLTSLADDRCSYISRDHLTGPLTPMVALSFGKAMRDGFNGAGYGLKKYAEDAYSARKSAPA